MIKKLTLTSLIFTACTTISHAGIFYMGPSLQYESIKADNNSSFQTISPRLTLGYAEKLAFPYYLAGELFGVFGNINGHPSDSDLRNTPSFGLAALPGFMLYDNTFLYGRLGVISTEFSNNNAYTFGGQVGAGIETSLTDTWDMRAEYIFTQYGNIDADGSNYGSPYSNAVAIGFIHRFK